MRSDSGTIALVMNLMSVIFVSEKNMGNARPPQTHFRLGRCRYQREGKVVRGEGTGVPTKVVAGVAASAGGQGGPRGAQVGRMWAGCGVAGTALIRVPKTADSVAIESGEHCSFRNYGVAPQGCGYVPITFKCVMGGDGDAV
jgi:hypothetical protein